MFSLNMCILWNTTECIYFIYLDYESKMNLADLQTPSCDQTYKDYSDKCTLMHFYLKKIFCLVENVTFPLNSTKVCTIVLKK